MLLEHRLDLGGRDVLPARDDRVALAADHRQAALVVEAPEVAGAQRVPLPHDGRAVDEDLAVVGDADPEPGQRPARRLEVARLGQRDGRARLGEPVGLGDRASPPSTARAQQAGRDGPAAQQHPPQPRAGRPPASRMRASIVGTSETSVMSPSRSSRATRSASNGGGSSTTVPAAAALRTSTISPPTCDSGIGTSQRSSGSEPSTAPAARTCAARLPKVSSTGRGARVVPRCGRPARARPRRGRRG